MVCAIFEVVLQKRQKCFKITSGRARLCPASGQSENFDTRVQPNGVRGSFFVEIFCTHESARACLARRHPKICKNKLKRFAIIEIKRYNKVVKMQ